MMRLPSRLKEKSLLTKLVAACAIAMVSVAVAWGLSKLPGTSIAMGKLDWLFYDAFYKLRPEEDRKTSDILIINVDEGSLKTVDEQFEVGWPWPREYWGLMAKYLSEAGARAIVFDIIFEQRAASLDDPVFAELVQGLTTPVIFGTQVDEKGNPGKFRVPIEHPTFGAVNVVDDAVLRHYPPTVNGADSLALSTIRNAGFPIRSDMKSSPFLVFYPGPYVRHDQATTYRYIPAVRLLEAAAPDMKLRPPEIKPEIFKDKIVVFGGTALGTYDVKSSPLYPILPGVELQAAAIDGLITGRYVHQISEPWAIVIAIGTAMVASLGVGIPKKTSLKLAGACVAIILLMVIGVMMFRASSVYWLPLAIPISAILISAISAFAYSYMTEDRARKLVLKALSQYLSPEVASEISKTGRGLSLGGTRREMTVLFTDIAGFTDVSERLSSEQLTEMINFYLDHMTKVLFDERATVDKFIGDAIMSFWNAPLSQEDHAERACRAAIRMAAKELEILPELGKRGAAGIHTRLGINTGMMTVGNMGSSQKFNYTVMGDPVNLGSRLEGANKMYGSTIMIAQSTADLVKGKFLMRQLDLLRVKGKLQPIAVYELMAIGEGSSELRQRKSGYDTAYQQYRNKMWDSAEKTLLRLLAVHPDDAPAATLLTRIGKMRHEDLPDAWDGVYVAKEK